MAITPPERVLVKTDNSSQPARHVKTQPVPTMLSWKNRLLILVLACAGGLNGVAHAQNANCRAVSKRTCTIASELGRGINLGEMLEAPREGDYGFRLENDFLRIAATNFKTVRLPVRFSNHAAPTEDATLDDFFAGRVDNIIDTLLAAKVYVILDLHNYREFTGTPVQPAEASVAPEIIDARFLNLWRQLAERYKNKSDHLIFELYNEPNGRLTASKWNGLAAQALAIVRSTNPARTVMISGVEWGHPRALSQLVVPNDPNLIVSIHNYDPFDFTHQGALWLQERFHKTGISCCAPDQRAKASAGLDIAQKWSEANGYPITLGEFGSYMGAELPARVEYARFVRDEAEKRGFSWQYWGFVGGFGIFNAKTRAWIEPLRAALLD